MEKGKFLHLTLEERQIIAEGMNNRLTFTLVGERIGKHRTTITRELQRHSLISYPKVSREGKAQECVNKDSCTKPRCIGHQGCKDYKVELCKKIVSAPYVCNGCPKARGCKNVKFYYSARNAHNMYLEELTKSRMGMNMSLEELARVNDLVHDRIISKKQSPYHIFASLEEHLNMSIATFYRLVHAGLLETKKYHLPTVLRYRQRKKKIKLEPKTQKYKEGRTYEDFKRHLALTLPSDVAQMDTVLGKKIESYALLTFVFEKSNFLLAIKIERNTALSVRNVLRSLQRKLGIELYSKLFGTILTDNGSEFKVPESIELVDEYGEIKSSVFYCDPYRANQKGKVENAHRLIRRIIPKGRSLKSYTQDDITLMCNHINSMKRESLHGLSAHEAFVKQYGRLAANLLGSTPVSAEDVCINESIFFC